MDDVVVSSEVFSVKFHCNLKKCKGACCWEGDFGAPVSKDEEAILDDIMPVLLPTMSVSSQKVINDQGTSVSTSYHDDKVTPLLSDASCVYLVKDELGISRCGIEQAYEKEMIDFKKPVSCHLYPIRVTKNDITGYEALNYDEWDICSDACALGEQKGMPVFRFVKDALIRKYGVEFYAQLEDIYDTYFRKGKK